MERGISADYLTLLESFYTEWLDSFDLCPVLVVPSQNLDFVRRPDHLDIVVGRIEQRLAGKEDVVFPE
jgi:deoxyadenosine/deoxycytidine kinase